MIYSYLIIPFVYQNSCICQPADAYNKFIKINKNLLASWLGLEMDYHRITALRLQFFSSNMDFTVICGVIMCC